MKKITLLVTLFALYTTAQSQTVSVYSSGYTTLEGIAINSNNEVHVSEHDSGKIFKVATDGSRTQLAVAGGYANDMVFDANNNLYFAEPFTSKISVINKSTGVVSTYKSTFSYGSSPYGMAINNGLIHFSAENSSKVIKINSDLTTTDVAATDLYTPEGIAFDKAGNLYIADRGNRELYKITPAGTKTTLASGIVNIRGVAVAADNMVYFTTSVSYPVANKIMKYDPTTGAVTDYVTTLLNNPRNIEIDKLGNMYVTNQGNGTVVKISDPALLAVDAFSVDNSVTVHPNPCKDVLSITSTLDIAKVTIYTITGQKLLESTKSDINVEGLTAGVYLVKIEDADKNNVIKKFVKS